MRRRLFAVLVLAGPVLAVTAAEPESYTIKLKSEPDIGKPVLVRETKKNRGSIKLSAGDRLINEDKPNITEEEEYTETILAVADKQPQKYKRTYIKAFVDNGEKVLARSYEGRTVLFEKKDGKWVVQVQGKPALNDFDEKQLLALANEQSTGGLEKLFAPDRPVKVGESWTVEPKLLKEGLGKAGELDLTRSKGEGRLARAYKKDGKQMGVVDVHVTLAYKTLNSMPFAEPAIADLRLSVDMPIDGSSSHGTATMSSKLTGKSQFEDKGMKLTAELNINVSGKQVRSAPE
jgi:hypothetical protein